MMKKITSLFLAILIILSLVSCNAKNGKTPSTDTTASAEGSESTEGTSTVTTGQTEGDPVEKQNWEEDGVLKILCIGNSFSQDTMANLYGILKDLGVENVKLGNLVIGGCTVFTHYSHAKSGNAAYTYSENTSGTWRDKDKQVLNTIVASDNWDFISLQQASHDSGVKSSYTYLPKLIEIVEDLCPAARLVWNMTWAYQSDATHSSFPVYDRNQMTMYRSILSAVNEKVLSEPSIELVSPAGTAIQNARAGWIGDTITIDGFHLSEVGRYIAALTFAQTLTGLSVENVKYAPTGLNLAEQKLAIESAMLACEKPYEISTPTAEAPKAPSIDDLYQLNVEFDRGYYYAPQDGGKHFDRYQGSDFDNMFYSTQIFTKETLPVGSIIVIAEGWQYRPESWLGDEMLDASLRPNSRTDTMIIVDELWWGDFTLRAFNLSKNPQVSLLDLSAEDMNEIFKVYVPYEPVDNTPTTPSVEDLYQLNVEFDRGYYYAPQGDGKHFDRYQGSDFDNMFYSTQIFNKETLPVGSIIVIAEGWQYRPESWLGDEMLDGSLRPNSRTDTMIIVDEAWWGDFTLRAFNLSKNPQVSLLDLSTDDMKEIFKIYVPYDPSVAR